MYVSPIIMLIIMTSILLPTSYFCKCPTCMKKLGKKRLSEYPLLLWNLLCVKQSKFQRRKEHKGILEVGKCITNIHKTFWRGNSVSNKSKTNFSNLIFYTKVKAVVNTWMNIQLLTQHLFMNILSGSLRCANIPLLLLYPQHQKWW